MQGWGSIGGVITGVVAALAAGMLLMHERENTRRAEDRASAAELRQRDTRREEALLRRRVAAAAVTYYLRQGAPDGAYRSPVDWAEGSHHLEYPAETGSLVIVNNSGGCVYRLVALAPDLPEAFDLRVLGVVPPGETVYVFPMKMVVDRGSTAGRVVGDYANSKIVPWIEFMDAAGDTWRRFDDGRLDEQADPVAFPDYSW
jgi:hypothetical protein